MPNESIFSVLRYADSRQGAEWLCEAYGFEVHEVIEQGENAQPYIMLRYGENYVIAVSIDSPALNKYMIQPSDAGNLSTQVCYISVDDIDQHYARSCAAGAMIEAPLDEASAGDERGYMSRDPEGHLWCFGPHPMPDSVKLATSEAPVSDAGGTLAPDMDMASAPDPAETLPTSDPNVTVTPDADVAFIPDPDVMPMPVPDVAPAPAQDVVPEPVPVIAEAPVVRHPEPGENEAWISRYGHLVAIFAGAVVVLGLAATMFVDDGVVGDVSASLDAKGGRATLASANTARAAARAEADTLRLQLRIAELRSARAQQHKQAVENALSETMRRFETEQAERQTKLDKLALAKHELTAQLKHHRALVASYQGDLQSLSQELKQLMTTNNGLSNEADALRVERDQLNSTLEETRGLLSGTEQRAVEVAAAEQELRQSLAEGKAKHAAAVERHKAAVVELQLAKAEFDKRLQEQQKTIDTINKNKKEQEHALAQARADIEGLERERAAAMQLAVELRTEGERLQGEVSGLKEKLAALTAAHANARKALASTKQLASARTGELGPLNKRLQEQQAEIGKITRDRAKVVKRLARMTGDVEKLEAAQVAARHEVGRLRAENERLARKADALTAKIATSETARQEAEREFARVSELLAKKNAAGDVTAVAAQFDGRIKDQQTLIASMRQDNDEIARELARARVKVQRVKVERLAARREVEQLRSIGARLTARAKELSAEVAALKEAQRRDNAKAARTKRLIEQKKRVRQVRRPRVPKTAPPQRKPIPAAAPPVVMSPIPKNAADRRDLLGSIFDCDASSRCD